jgi:hypothetical protein
MTLSETSCIFCCIYSSTIFYVKKVVSVFGLLSWEAAEGRKKEGQMHEGRRIGYPNIHVDLAETFSSLDA